MIIKNGKVLDKSFHFVDADVLVKDGKIVKIGKVCTCGEEEVIDAAGKYVIPGLVDIHTVALQRGERFLRLAARLARWLCALFAQMAAAAGQVQEIFFQYICACTL